MFYCMVNPLLASLLVDDLWERGREVREREERDISELCCRFAQRSNPWLDSDLENNPSWSPSPHEILVLLPNEWCLSVSIIHCHLFINKTLFSLVVSKAEDSLFLALVLHLVVVSSRVQKWTLEQRLLQRKVLASTKYIKQNKTKWYHFLVFLFLEFSSSRICSLQPCPTQLLCLKKLVSLLAPEFKNLVA